MKPCTGEAIEVAWKQNGFLYRRPDGAVHALRRACKGLSMEEAREMLALANAVLQEAFRILKPKDEATVEEYRRRVPNGPAVEERSRMERELRAKFPTCSTEALHRAIAAAVIYHIL